MNKSFSWSRARFTNDISLAIQFRWKIRLVVIQLFATVSQQISAYAMTAQLSSHVQNFVAINALYNPCERKTNLPYWIAMENPLVKRAPVWHHPMLPIMSCEILRHLRFNVLFQQILSPIWHRLLKSLTNHYWSISSCYLKLWGRPQRIIQAYIIW